MFCGLVYCADCGSPLWFNVNHPNTDIHYFMCSNYKGRRGTCEGTHYIRADSLEEVVKNELRKMCAMLKDREDEFVSLLEAKTNKNIDNERKAAERELQRSISRTVEVDRMYEHLYEDNVNGKVSDESFMRLSQKYESERDQLKEKIQTLRKSAAELEVAHKNKEQFVKAVRSFMEMQTLTPALLHELIEKIEVHCIEGSGVNKTQRITIHYRFMGVLDIPEQPEEKPIRLEARKGVSVEYLTSSTETTSKEDQKITA